MLREEACMRRWYPMAVSVAKRYFRKANGMDWDDLVQEAWIGILLSQRKYDPEKGTTESTYFFRGASFSARRAIENDMGRSPFMIPIDVRRARRYQSSLQTQERLRFNMPFPSEQVKAAFEAAPFKTIRSYAGRKSFVENTFTMQMFSAMSLDAVSPSDGQTLHEKLGVSSDPTETLLTDQRRSILNNALDRLSSVQRRVIKLRYGFEDGKEHSLREIGEILGISHQGVNNIEKTAVRHLMSLMENILPPRNRTAG